LLFREDVVKTFCGETLRQLRVVSSLAVGILVWALVFAGCSGSNTITITLSPASGVSLNPGATVTIIATLTNDTNNQGVSWTLSGPGQLSDNTTTSVVYIAPANISTAATATVTATSVANSSITTTETITLNAVLTIATTSLPAGTLQTSYNTFVDAEGATGTFTWSVTAGSLPPGLTFQTTSTSTSAEIEGIPTVLGTYKFTVQVTDSSGNTVTQALSITINPAPPLAVATGSLPNGQVGTTYTQALQASSGTPPYTWSLISNTTLPIGLSLASNGAISGTPIASGTFNFEVQVVDSSTPQQSASANLSITINPGPTDNARLSGYYVFSVGGFDVSGLFVAAGEFLSDGKGNISGGLMDINQTDTGSSPTNPSFTGTYYVGQNGLGYMTFNLSFGGSRSFAFSMLSGGNANIIEFDDSTGGFVNGTAHNSGMLLQQDTSASVGSITGGYAFGFAGVDASKNRFGVAGFFDADGAGNITNGAQDSDDAGTLGTNVPFTGAYTIAGNGRGTATIGNSDYSFYVAKATTTQPTQLLTVGIDPFVPGGNPLLSGSIMQQANSGFTNASFNAASVFEITGLDASIAESQVGVFTGNGAGGFSLNSDQNSGGTLTSPSGTGGYSVAANGRVTLSGSGFQNSQPVLYMVNSNQAFVIGTDTAVSFGSMTPQQSGFALSGTYAGGSLPPVDPAVSNVVSIGIAGASTLDLTQDISSDNGLSVFQASDVTQPSVGNPARVLVTQTGNQTQILYLVSATEFFALDAPSPANGDTTARVDIFQQ